MSMMIQRIALLLVLIVPTIGFGQVVADSVADWSADGTQGAMGWTYGFYNATADPDGEYGMDDFTAFEGPDWIWTGSAWDEANVDGDNVPWTTVAADSGHPNGDNNGDVHWAIRRWVSSHEGPVTIDYTLSKQNVSCGNGTTAALFIDGTEVSSATVEFSDGAGIMSSVSANLANGTVIDLALTPLGTDGTLGDGCDGSLFGMAVSVVPEPSSAALLLCGIPLFLRRRRS